MILRPATPADAPQVATCLLLAMEEIVYSFIGSRDRAEAHRFLEDLVRAEGNQYSYGNCQVAELDGVVVAAVNIYPGADLHALRGPVLDLVRVRFGREINPEDETGPGEYYLDTLGVLPGRQGRGIGTQLLQYAIDEYVHRRRAVLGLLVDDDNPEAKRLYLRLGFITAGTKTLMGKQLCHLQMAG
ncbi:GNAT family N-acetyltransferase [Flaviaesturariibacter amylovorans]|uniref:GNAT family N-acetyltransferase n=1 Tax=Flaviaesturariibacter amylovorans TaxID=1084520 RepID=A0ABP8G6V9_9BACT